MNVNLITRKIIHSTPTRMALKGGVTTNNRVITGVARNLRKFLAEHKGSHLGQDELESFYRKYFPEANLKIIDMKLNKNEEYIAESTVSYTDDMKEIEEFQIHLQSKSQLDKLKNLLSIPNKNKSFYVNKQFSETYIHEYVHFMQRYLKPIDKTLKNSLLSHCPEDSDMMKAVRSDLSDADQYLVYKSEEGKNFTPEDFRLKLMAFLNEPEYSTNMLVKDELKFLIRHSQAEKQAYEIEMEEASWISHPKLMKNKHYRKFRKKILKNELEKTFCFEEKIRVMKEEYFKLIEHERKNR